MSSTSDEIKQSLIDSIKKSNDSMDVTKGPLLDLIITPVSQEIGNSVDEINNIQSMLSIFASASDMTSEFLQALGTNLGVSRLSGVKAVGTISFYFNAALSSDITIPAGTKVATTDNVYSFYTNNDVKILKSQAINYYKAAKGRYEITTSIVAGGYGTKYNLPANRITLIPTSIDGINGCYNNTPTTNGKDAESDDDYLTMIRQKWLGNDSTSIEGIRAYLYQTYGPSLINSLNIITSNDPCFKRHSSGTGIDLYVSSDLTIPQLAEDTVTGISTRNETRIYFENNPVVSISSVLIDGVSIDNYQLISDTDVETRGSIRAKDYISIPSSISTFQKIVTVSYYYDNSVNDIQSKLESRLSGVSNIGYSESTLFGSDVIVRQADTVDLYINLTVYLLSKASTGLISSLKDFLISYVMQNGFSSLDYLSLQNEISNNFQEIASASITELSDQLGSNLTYVDNDGTHHFSVSNDNITITIR